MAVFTVHLPIDAASPLAEAGRARFVREGFSFGAFLFGPLWLAARRLWLGLALWFAAAALVVAADRLLAPPRVATFFCFVVIALGFGLQGAALRRAALERRGYRFADVVAGVARDDCERAFFARWRDAELTPPGAPFAPPAASGRAPAPDQPVLGLFPEPGTRR